MNDKTVILVVDDEEIVCESVKKILSRESYEVDMVMDAPQALALARSKPYSLLITDLMMPEMNGIELMHSLRKHGLDIPFLMITGYPTIKTAMQALRLGAIDYIPKPFTRTELISPVNRALRRREILEASTSVSAPENTCEPVKPGDCFVLPGHSWAVYDQDGTVTIGIEESFLGPAGPVAGIETPDPNEMIEQGYPTIKVKTRDENVHGVFSPLSGRVVTVNQQILDDPQKLDSSQWVLRIIPSCLQADIVMLVKKLS